MTITSRNAEQALSDGASDGAQGGLGALLRRHVGWAPSPTSKRSQRLASRLDGARVTTSVCPYCAVGCSQLVYSRDGKVIDIEGNPASPINAGHLCPKGAATYQLINNPNRPTSVLYRAPGSDHWEERSLDWAMDRIAQLTKATRDQTFQEKSSTGKTLMSTTAIFSLGGATIDNEWNYAHSKLMRGLGIVPIENQARI